MALTLVQGPAGSIAGIIKRREETFRHLDKNKRIDKWEIMTQRKDPKRFFNTLHLLFKYSLEIKISE